MSHQLELAAAARARLAGMGVDVPIQWETMKKWQPRSVTGLQHLLWRGSDGLLGENVQFAESGYIRSGPQSLISIGDNTFLRRTTLDVTGENSAVIIGPQCELGQIKIIITAPNCLVVIGKRTTWESGAAVCADGRAVVINEDCMLSNDVLIRTSDGHGIFDLEGTLQNHPGDVIIDPHVWLGNGVRVNKGAFIPLGSVVGQGSVVSKTLQKRHFVYGGAPAKPLRGPVNWGRKYDFSSVPERFRSSSPIDGEEIQPRQRFRDHVTRIFKALAVR